MSASDAAGTSQGPEALGLEAQLEQAEGFLRRLDDQALAGANTIAELRQRLSQGRLHLAVLGQFKRGKSTLLNALIGEEVLPTAVVPLTAVPTFLRFGAAPALRVSYADSRQAEQHPGGSVEELRARLTGLVTEIGNPNNRLGISQVEAFLPSPLLARGVVLVDTPGIGSTLRHNTEATMNFLPQCDAALFVLSADPPLTDAEAQFLKAVRVKVRKLFFLLNKVDYLEAGELEEARAFIAAVLAEKAGLNGSAPLFTTSARWGLEARRNNDPRRWEQSGLKAVEERLVAFLAEEKHKTLAEAVCIRAGAALEEAALGLELAIRSWQLSLEDLEDKVARFAAKAEELRREADHSEDLLSGDQQRLQQKLEEQAEALRSKARAHLGELLERQAGQSGELSEQKLQSRLAEAVPAFFEHEMTEMVGGFKKELDEVMEPHRRRSVELVGILKATAAELFEVPASTFEDEETLESFEEPSWVIHSWKTVMHPIPPGLIDQLLSPSRRKTRLLRRLLELVEELVITNVESLRWSVLQSLVQAFLVNKPLVRERLTKLLQATQEAVQRTLEKRRAMQQSSTPEIARLQEQLQELRRLQDGIRGSAGVKA